jgi:hypothetical protein
MGPATDKTDSKPTTTASAKLPRRTSAVDFDEGYYYAAELREFARELGFTVGKFRKIELENLQREPLTIDILPKHRPVMPRKAGATCDKLTADTLIVNYVGD